MSETDPGGGAEHVDASAVHEEQVRTVDSVVLATTVEVSDPPEPMTEEPHTLRRPLDAKIADIFSRMGGPETPEDELDELEERFRRGLLEEENAARVVIDDLRKEQGDLAKSNDQALRNLGIKRETLGRLDGLVQTADAELALKKAHLARAHEALIKLGTEGGTAEEIETVMAEIDPEAAERLVSARHGLREKPVVPEPEPEPEPEPTRELKPVATDGEPDHSQDVTRELTPVTPQGDQRPEVTQPWDAQASFAQEQPGADAGDPLIDVSTKDGGAAAAYLARIQKLRNEQSGQPGQTAKPDYEWPKQQ